MDKKILFLLTVVIIGFSAVFVSNKYTIEKDKILASFSGDLEIKNEKKINEDRLKKEIGQMIMVGFRGLEAKEGDDIEKIIKDVSIGGVVLFDNDVPSGNSVRNIESPGQVKKLISGLQSFSKTPLFISVDAEGGEVNRLKGKYGFEKILSAQEMGKDKTLETTKKESKKLATELNYLGFNMNLAPVVDLDLNPKNPIIGKLGRSFSNNSDEVVKNAEVFINIHENKNIITVEKHFPGQGNAKVDTHIGIADVTDTFNDEELTPYLELNKKGLLDAVMVAHIINKKIDQEYPATMSRKFITDILRNQIGFDGVVISDDMQMGAIMDNYSLSEAVIGAVNAGTDIIVVSNNTKSGYDENIAYKVRDIILDAVKNGTIKEGVIRESYKRIMDLKEKFNF